MRITFLIIIVISFFVTVAVGQEDQIRRHLVRAETAIKLEQYQDAVNEYKAALLIDPRNANIYYNLATIQEKIGSSEALLGAIENFKKYLLLVPNGEDCSKVKNKIYSLEFQLEKQMKLVEQSENLQGVWRSDWYYKETGIPFWFFNIEQAGNDLRITILPKSALFRSDFTYQTITIPYTGDMLFFTFTNDTKFQPSNIETTIQHSILDAATTNQVASAFNPLLHGLIDMQAQQAFQSISTYIFKLNISPDTLYGTCQTIIRRIDANSDKIIKDEISHVAFTKNDENYPAMTKEELKEGKRQKRKSIPSCRAYYSIPFGITASADVTNKKSGYFSSGGGLGLSWKTPSPKNIDLVTGNIAQKLQAGAHKRNTGTCVNLNAYYYKLSAPYGLKITGGYPDTEIAKYADIIPGQTDGSNFGLDMTIGKYGYVGLNEKAFLSYTICPVGFAEEITSTARIEPYKMPWVFQISYHGELSLGLNFRNKNHTSQGVFIGYGWGIPFFTFLSKEEKDQTATIHHQPKAQIWKNLLNIGFEYTF
ncbi:MAG: tetratricopeptide repeat protein [Prolixibacteraceae bacterium]|jgi:hypothetical protein|nr:tetratricopeptide repeat protein [Prolixibacteraceae bacterium]